MWLVLFSKQPTQKTQRQLPLRFMEIFLSTTTQYAMEQKLTSMTVGFQHLIPIRLVHLLALFSVFKVADTIKLISDHANSGSLTLNSIARTKLGFRTVLLVLVCFWDVFVDSFSYYSLFRAISKINDSS